MVNPVSRTTKFFLGVAVVAAMGAVATGVCLAILKDVRFMPATAALGGGATVALLVAAAVKGCSERKPQHKEVVEIELQSVRDDDSAEDWEGCSQLSRLSGRDDDSRSEYSMVDDNGSDD